MRETRLEQADTQGVGDLEDGEVASSKPIANKIYIQGDGISALTSRGLENFAKDSFDDGGAFQRIEWKMEHGLGQCPKVITVQQRILFLLESYSKAQTFLALPLALPLASPLSSPLALLPASKQREE